MKGESANYAYGDSSQSPFTSNFLELVRDSIDFAVYALQTDQRLQELRERTEARRRQAEAQLAELDALEQAVVASMTVSSGGSNSSVGECAAEMIRVSEKTKSSWVARITGRLSDELAEAESEERAEREACGKALFRLLSSRAAPGSTPVLRLRLHENENYEALLEGAWPEIGLSWTSELGIPDGHRFSDLLRVEDFEQHLHVHAPEHTGWLKKEVRVRPQRLDRFVIHDVLAEGPKVTLRLRSEPRGDSGFDFELDAKARELAASCLARPEGELVAGPFEVQDEDRRDLAHLCQTLQARLLELTTARLIEAKLGDHDFEDLPSFREIAERLIAFLSPFVQEIAAHSLEPEELVLRRELDNNRREEIFVAKSTLREKYEPLPAELRTLFDPLGLRSPLSRSLRPMADSQDPVVRFALSPSDPPPPPAKPSVLEEP